MLSFICASNNKKLYNQCIVPSLKIQKNRDFEIIRVDTTAKHYSSAAAALNDGASRAKGDYFVFLHQDIVIDNENFIDELMKMIKRQPFYVAGVAGAKQIGINRVHTNIIHSNNKIPAGTPCEKIIPMETLDECLFIIPREIFERKGGFKEYAPSWHFYCVEMCLWANKQKKNSVLLFPLKLWHLSIGNPINKSYFETLRAIQKEYPMKICTTCGNWPNNRFALMLEIVLRIVHRWWIQIKMRLKSFVLQIYSKTNHSGQS